MTSALCDALFVRNVCGLPRENDVRCLIIHSRAKVSVNEPLTRKYLQIFRFSSILCSIVSFLISFSFNFLQFQFTLYPYAMYVCFNTLLLLFIHSFSLFFSQKFQNNFVIFLTFFFFNGENRIEGKYRYL